MGADPTRKNGTVLLTTLGGGGTALASQSDFTWQSNKSKTSTCCGKHFLFRLAEVSREGRLPEKKGHRFEPDWYR